MLWPVRLVDYPAGEDLEDEMGDHSREALPDLSPTSRTSRHTGRTLLVGAVAIVALAVPAVAAAKSVPRLPGRPAPPPSSRLVPWLPGWPAPSPSGQRSVPATLYVGHGSTSATDRSCSAPGYGSVQAAVTAAKSGDTVYLCGAQFAEQVTLAKSITLTGQRGSGLTGVGSSVTSPGALLTITGGSPTVSGLTFSGPVDGGNSPIYGILAVGGSPRLADDTVRGIQTINELQEDDGGASVWVGNPNVFDDPDTVYDVSATIQGLTVSGYNKRGINVAGLGATALIEGNTVTGAGPTSATAQNGIEILFGARATISGNHVSDNQYAGGNVAAASGILVSGGWPPPLATNSVVEGNYLVNNDMGIDFLNYNDDGSGVPTTPTRDVAEFNTVTSSAVTNVSGVEAGVGYQAGIVDNGNRDEIIGNDISGRGYAVNGKLDWQVSPEVFTKTNGVSAFTRPIDAGLTWYDTDPVVFGNH